MLESQIQDPNQGLEREGQDPKEKMKVIKSKIQHGFKIQLDCMILDSDGITPSVSKKQDPQTNVQTLLHSPILRRRESQGEIC